MSTLNSRRTLSFRDKDSLSSEIEHLKNAIKLIPWEAYCID